MVIIAAVDRSERGKQVTAEAEHLAEAFDMPLHVVHVLSGYEFTQLERTAYEESGKTLPPDEVEKLAEEFAEQAAANINRDYKAVGLRGEVADSIVEHADDQGARYITVAGRQRSPTGKAVFGSTVQSILLTAKCPVVTVISEE